MLLGTFEFEPGAHRISLFARLLPGEEAVNESSYLRYQLHIEATETWCIDLYFIWHDKEEPIIGNREGIPKKSFKKEVYFYCFFVVKETEVGGGELQRACTLGYLLLGPYTTVQWLCSVVK